MPLQNLHTFLKSDKITKLLAVFPHPDDESFCVGGLCQLAQDYNIKTSLMCLTKGEKGLNSYGKGSLKTTREAELRKASKILGIDELLISDYQDAGLKETTAHWLPKLHKEIARIKPDVIVTFDHSGITGHPDHIVVSVELLKLLKNLSFLPVLLWRVPDSEEKKYFKENPALSFASEATHGLAYNLSHSLKKIQAIYRWY